MLILVCESRVVSRDCCNLFTECGVLSIPHSFTAASRSPLVSVIALVKSAMALSISHNSWSSFSLAFRKSSARCLHDRQDHNPPISACGILRHLQWYHVIHRQHCTMSPPDRPLRCWHPGMQWLDSEAVTEHERFGFRVFDFPNDFDDFSLTTLSAFPVAPSGLVAETSEFTSSWPSSMPGCTASPIESSAPTTGWVVASAASSLAAHAFDILSARIFHTIHITIDHLCAIPQSPYDRNVHRVPYWCLQLQCCSQRVNRRFVTRTSAPGFGVIIPTGVAAAVAQDSSVSLRVTI